MGSKSTKKLRQADRTKSSAIPQYISTLNGQVDTLKAELRELRRLAREGVLAVEMLRLRPDVSSEDASYEELRRQALRSLVLTEGLVEKLGLRIDSRSECADKYALSATSALCDELTSSCRGACCKEKFALTAQDIIEGVVEFDLDNPYMIKMSPSGYCTHFDPDSMTCRIWEERPARCRLYTCRWDRGVWKDYVKRIPSDKIAELSSKQEESSDKDASRATVKGKPGIPLDPSTFDVFQCNGDRLIYDVSKGQIMHVNPVAFDILSEMVRRVGGAAAFEQSVPTSPKRVCCPLRRGGMGILPVVKGCRRGRLRYIHGLRAPAASNLSRTLPRRASAGALPLSHGLQSVELQCRRFLPEQASAWLLDEGIHPCPPHM